MNFGQAFTYVFEDPDWAKKVLIPALIALIPIVGEFVLLGWMLDITRRVIQGNPRPLPDLDFGRQFVEGLKGFIIGLVYALPIILFVVPITIASSMANSQTVDQNSVGWLVGIVSVCCGGLIFLYSILLAFVLPAAMANYAASGNLSAAFRFKEIFALLRAAPGAYLLTLLGVIAAGFVAGLGTIACVIGALATLAYSQAVTGHLYGQAYVEANRNRGLAQAY